MFPFLFFSENDPWGIYNGFSTFEKNDKISGENAYVFFYFFSFSKFMAKIP